MCAFEIVTISQKRENIQNMGYIFISFASVQVFPSVYSIFVLNGIVRKKVIKIYPDEVPAQSIY